MENVHELTPCQAFGHTYENDPDRPEVRVCTQPGCGDEYED